MQDKMEPYVWPFPPIRGNLIPMHAFALLLGGDMGQYLNPMDGQEMGVGIWKIGIFLLKEEETANHLLIHCTKMIKLYGF